MVSLPSPPFRVSEMTPAASMLALIVSLPDRLLMVNTSVASACSIFSPVGRPLALTTPAADETTMVLFPLVALASTLSS